MSEMATKEKDQRQQIIQTAERLFREIGFQKTTVADIARELRMSPANVYRFFGAKSEINEAVMHFIQKYGVKSVVMPDRIIGCPHEEGVDYPEGQSCPQCPYWAGRDRFTGKLVR